jgi:ribosomal protein S2
MFLPIIAIIDSNVKSFLVKFPIISNDDSMESFYFIFNTISKLILLLKYKKLILWFFKYKRVIKEINFKKLVNYLYYVKKINLKKIFKPLNLFNKFN